MTAHVRSWARALGGDVSGCGVTCPGPGHSARDRSLSVTQSATSPDGFIVYSHAGDDWQACRDHVRGKLGLPEFSPERPSRRVAGGRQSALGYRGPVKAVTVSDNGRKAARLWGNREPVSESCPAGLYLRRARRFDGVIPPTLGYLRPNGKHPPAMIAAFGFCEELEPGMVDPPTDVTGVHITRLTPEGGKAPEDKSKIMLGPMSGLPIVLAPVNDGLGACDHRGD